MNNTSFAKMIPWVCMFYGIQKDDTNPTKRLVYRGEDCEKKTERNAIIKFVIQNGLGDISNIADIIEQEVTRCKAEGINYTIAIYYNHVLVEPDLMSHVKLSRQLYFDLQNLYQDDLK